MSGETVRLAREERSAWLTIDRPPLNVLDLATIERLYEALGECARDPSVLVVVLRAAGERAFSAGVDVADHAPERVPAMLEAFHRVIRLLWTWDRVSISAVQAPALGGGCELALSCDLVFAATGVEFATPEIDVGCFPPVALAAWPRRIGRARAADFLLTGRRFPAAEALAAGLLTRVVRREGLDAAVRECREALLAKSPAVLRIALKAMREAERLEFPEALARAEEVYRTALLATEDCREGIAAFRAKRAPVWRGR
ncbi:MAG TPA: enoyl-CoA hydratase-related protein [Planctomycetota bacterium]|nr:enoyl-CoA hydratase-related protein [Planctomycetota bacterium]